MQSNSRLRSTTLPHLQTGFSIRAKRARTRPRSIWLHGKKASAFGRSARERHHGPRWEQKNAAHCCQQTARHTTSSYRASWINAQIAAPLGSYDAANLTLRAPLVDLLQVPCLSPSVTNMNRCMSTLRITLLHSGAIFNGRKRSQTSCHLEQLRRRPSRTAVQMTAVGDKRVQERH